MSRMIRVLTVIGTRPEIIRLAPTIKKLDRYTEHILVHTGQNYDYELNEVFFDDLGLREPDRFLAADTTSLGSVLGSIIIGMERVLLETAPDAVLILGDTNSSIASVVAKRMKVPVFHMEAGNRSFDENVPEETNRRLIDHIADYNLVYTEHARRNLLSEGIHPTRILLTGSPMREVLESNAGKIAESDILERQNLRQKDYFLVSLHREENVDNPHRLGVVLRTLNALVEEYGLPVLVSTHPRTRVRLEQQDDQLKRNLIFHAPFGFHDYIKLQQESKLVLSDSGTISEESSLLRFPAVTLREFIERPEALDTGSIMTTGIETPDVLQAVRITLGQWDDMNEYIPADYLVSNTSRRVVNFVCSTVHSHYHRTGIRAFTSAGES